jgi:hypothetical protein
MVYKQHLVSLTILTKIPNGYFYISALSDGFHAIAISNGILRSSFSDLYVLWLDRSFSMQAG